MKTYVVQDYDCVAYAGPSKKAAIAKVHGSGCIQVWQSGKIIGILRYIFDKKRWEFKN